MSRRIRQGLAAMAIVAAAAASVTAKPLPGKQGDGPEPEMSERMRDVSTPGAQADLIADYRRRLASEVAAQSPSSDPESRTALEMLIPDAEFAEADAFVGDYLCTVYGAIDNYLGDAGVYLYRSGTFTCVIQRDGDGLRLRKTSGAPLDLVVAEPERGIFTFRSDYHSGLVMPERPWYLEMVDADTVRILPFEAEMPAELARTGAPLSGADLNMIVLRRR